MIFDGGWTTPNAKDAQAINYWWGMSSGAIDVALNPDLSDGTKQLASIIRKDILDGDIDPFRTKMTDQHGNVKNNGERSLAPDEIMNMDWLLDNVEGHIPEFEELLPVSQNLVRLLGLHRNEILPTPEEVIL